MQRMADRFDASLISMGEPPATALPDRPAPGGPRERVRGQPERVRHKPERVRDQHSCARGRTARGSSGTGT